MLDLAFRLRWHEPFLSPDDDVPKTWLNRRLTENLYRTFEYWSTPGHGLTLAARVQGRWLNFQITDTPAQALGSLTLFTHVARFSFARRAWGTAKNLGYAPAYTPPDPPPRVRQ